jgi:serine/threonine-protein kinase
MAKRVNGNPHPTVSGALRFLAYTLHHANKLAEAESVAREALAIDRMMSDKDRNPSLAWSLDELAAILNEQGRLAEAEDLLREALAIQRQVLGNQSKYSSTTFQLLIDVLRKEGKLAEADKLSREAPALTTRSSPATQP